jgi:acetylornithine deacetylase/succinyl-diaminopimelate desuccinylase-like protein
MTETAMSDLLAWAERFVATPSVTRDGNQAMAALAAELLASLGIASRVQSDTLDGRPHANVIADLGPPGRDGLLLLTHLDTVPPGDAALWTRTGGDPFRPTRDGDRLYGLGSADAKVDFACKAFALEGLDPASLVRPLRLVGTFAEETGLHGARLLVRSGETRGFRWAMVGEPSELVAIHAHKGYAVFEAVLPAAEAAARGDAPTERLCFRGESAHSSTPHLGVNAIELALERVAAADVAGVARIEGGGVLNKVPDACELEIVRRAGAGYGAAALVEFHRAWRALLGKLATDTDALFDPPHAVGNLGRVEMRDGRPVFGFDLRTIPGMDARRAVAPLERVAEIRCLRANPPLHTPPDAPLVQAVARAQRAAGVDARLGTKATSTEAGLLAEAGLQVLIHGAGPSVGNVHRPNEHTRVSELALAARFYHELVREVCVDGELACSA